MFGKTLFDYIMLPISPAVKHACEHPLGHSG